MYTNSGIYIITNILTGQIYIGSAKNFEDRWRRHVEMLNKKNHPNTILKHSVTKYGLENFCFEIFESGIPYEDLLSWEQAAFDYFEPEYNICKFAGNSFGRILSDQTKIKISESNKGKKREPRSLEVKLKISKTKTGVNRAAFSKEWRQNISISNKGKTMTEESKLKISKSHIGKRKPEKWVLANRGEGNPQAKLTQIQVNEIKLLITQGKIMLKDIAQKFQVSPTTITSIKKGNTWV